MEAIYLYKVVAHLLSPQQQKHTHTQVTDGRVRPVAPAGGGESGLPVLSKPEAHKSRKCKQTLSLVPGGNKFPQKSLTDLLVEALDTTGHKRALQPCTLVSTGFFFPLLGFMWFLFPSVRISLCLTPWGPWRTEPWLRQGLLWSPPSGRHWI